jgi:hypothetical protein
MVIRYALSEYIGLFEQSHASPRACPLLAKFPLKLKIEKITMLLLNPYGGIFSINFNCKLNNNEDKIVP